MKSRVQVTSRSGNVDLVQETTCAGNVLSRELRVRVILCTVNLVYRQVLV